MEAIVWLIAIVFFWYVLFVGKKKKQRKRANPQNYDSVSSSNTKCTSVQRDIAEHHAFHEMKYPIQSLYVDLDNKFRSFRITTMKRRDFENFYIVGTKLLELFPQYIPMVIRDAELHDYDALYFYENVPIKLLDYCCRFGEIEKGRLVLSFMDKHKIFREEFFEEQFDLFYAREQAIRCAKDFLARNGETAKTVMIKEMPYVEKEHLQWAMRFYKGFSVRKDGSKYFVSICDIK